MLFKHCLFFIATALLTFSVAIPIPSGAGQPQKSAGPSRARRRQNKRREGLPTLAPPPWAIERMEKTKNLPGVNDLFSVGKRPSRARRRQNKRREGLPTLAPPPWAIERMEKTKNLPGVNDLFSVGKSTFTGKMVGDAIALSFLPRVTGYPRPYGNHCYHETHPDASLHGKRPIPEPHNPHSPHNPPNYEHNPPNYEEYPLTHQENGWSNNAPPGPARVIMSNDGKHDIFHGVVGHDPERGGVKEHYLATHTKAKEEG